MNAEGSQERTDQVTAIVLAGGRSSRFGAPKLDALVDGASLLELAIRAVAAVASEIVVALPAAGGPATRTEPAVGPMPGNPVIRFVRDPELHGGPLVGLATALEIANRPYAIVVGGDMPRLRPAVLRAMLDWLQAGGARSGGPVVEAVVLERAGVPRPLPLAIRTGSGVRAATTALASGERSLRSMLARLALKVLEAQAWQALDPRSETLIDIDERADLDRLVSREAASSDRP